MFLFVQLAILARYFVYGVFDPILYGSTFLFLFGAVVVYVVSKTFVKKELAYTPKETATWSFLNLQHTFNVEKPLFKGDIKRGYIQQIFQKKWQYLMADIIGSTFFLTLKVIIDEHKFEIKPTKGKWFSNQSYWTIYKNGQEIGSAKTVVDLKNTAKLKEVIEIHVNEQIYSTAANTITSQITLLHNNQQIGEMKRNHLISNVHTIDVEEDSPEKILALILHAFHFKK